MTTLEYTEKLRQALQRDAERQAATCTFQLRRTPKVEPTVAEPVTPEPVADVTPTNTVEFDTTLRTLAAQATERYAGEKARIDRGLTIALNHGVTFLPNGTTLVKSQCNTEIVYEVKAGRCDCPDAERAPEYRCKHRWAACFTKKATAAVPKPMTYYATYYTSEDTCLQGTATYLDKRGWVFRDEDDSIVIAYAEEANLVLGGRVDILEAQRKADGNLAAKVCGY